MDVPHTLFSLYLVVLSPISTAESSSLGHLLGATYQPPRFLCQVLWKGFPHGLTDIVQGAVSDNYPGKVST